VRVRNSTGNWRRLRSRNPARCLGTFGSQDPGPRPGDVRGLGIRPGTLGCPWACSPARDLGMSVGPEPGLVSGDARRSGIWPGAGRRHGLTGNLAGDLGCASENGRVLGVTLGFRAFSADAGASAFKIAGTVPPLWRHAKLACLRSHCRVSVFSRLEAGSPRGGKVPGKGG
jgi:hypothetical protein